MKAGDLWPHEPLSVPVIKPTPPQMRFLHVLAHSRLTIRMLPPFNKHVSPGRTFNLRDIAGKDESWRFSPIVINRVVENGWAQMKGMRPDRAEYVISATGKEALKELCSHGPNDERLTEILAGNLICKKCARSVRCKSKQRTPHGAHRWHARYGPICNACWRFLYG